MLHACRASKIAASPKFSIMASFLGLGIIERECDLKSTPNESSILAKKQRIGKNLIQKTS
jgi:hypothetical protein